MPNPIRRVAPADVMQGATPPNFVPVTTAYTTTDERVESEVWAEFQRKMDEKKAAEKKELEKNPRWAISWSQGKPTFALNKYGFENKTHVVDKAIKDFKSAIKSDIRSLNEYMEELGRHKSSVAKLLDLKAETENEKKPAKKPKKAKSNEDTNSQG